MEQNKDFNQFLYNESKRILENDTQPYVVFPLEKQFIVDEQRDLIFVRLRFIEFVEEIQTIQHIDTQRLCEELNLSHLTIIDTMNKIHDPSNWYTYFDTIYVRIEEQVFLAMEEWIRKSQKHWELAIRGQAVRQMMKGAV